MSADDVVCSPDLPYCTLGDSRKLMLDVARPRASQGRFPAVLVVHGGGWLGGGRKSHRQAILMLAERGYVAVALSYQSSPIHPFPTQIHQVKCAVRWLRAHADDYQIDPNRIAALGHSSGGNLACLLGMTSPEDGLEGDHGYADRSSRVQAVVSLYGVVDPGEIYRLCLINELPPLERTYMKTALEAWLGGSPDRVAERYRKASLLSYVHRRVVPTLLIHGTADRLVPVEQSRMLRDALAKARVDVRLIEVEGAPHEFGGEYHRKAMASAMDFLDTQLRQSR